MRVFRNQHLCMYTLVVRGFEKLSQKDFFQAGKPVKICSANFSGVFYPPPQFCQLILPPFQKIFKKIFDEKMWQKNRMKIQLPKLRLAVRYSSNFSILGVSQKHGSRVRFETTDGTIKPPMWAVCFNESFVFNGGEPLHYSPIINKKTKGISPSAFFI